MRYQLLPTSDTDLPGDKCMYRHRLPPGFVLKSDKKKQEEDAKKEKISLEDFLEVEVRSLISRSHRVARADRA